MSSTASDTGSRPAHFETVRTLAAEDMREVDSLIRARLASDVALINEVGAHIVGSGGKRLRPMLHVLSARAAGYEGRQHLQLAAVIEFIHTATLLHDDVVDESDRRRGRSTANTVWGNAASVLVGDFLYSRAFQLMVELDCMPVMRILADTTNAIAEGEVLQLLNIGNAGVTETAYLSVIERKTAVLFAAAAELGGVLAGLADAQCGCMRRFGLELGFAFQIADDLLDYVADADTLGKNVGDDLAEGKPTLPMIYALESANPRQKAVLREALEQRELDSLEPVLAVIRESDALERTRERARMHAGSARGELAKLPPSPFLDALYALTDFAIVRDR